MERDYFDKFPILAFKKIEENRFIAKEVLQHELSTFKGNYATLHHANDHKDSKKL